jgi:hypothetical protein
MCQDKKRLGTDRPPPTRRSRITSPPHCLLQLMRGVALHDCHHRSRSWAVPPEQPDLGDTNLRERQLVRDAPTSRRNMAVLRTGHQPGGGGGRRPPGAGRPRRSTSPMRDLWMPTPGMGSRCVRHVFGQAGSRESRSDHSSVGRKFELGGSGYSLKCPQAIAGGGAPQAKRPTGQATPERHLGRSRDNAVVRIQERYFVG